MVSLGPSHTPQNWWRTIAVWLGVLLLASLGCLGVFSWWTLDTVEEFSKGEETNLRPMDKCRAWPYGKLHVYGGYEVPLHGT